MKILFVGVFSYESTNTSQADGFRKNGCEVIEFNYREIAQKIGNKGRDQYLAHTCVLEQPDAIIFSKCNEIESWVVWFCNKICKTILWYMDPLNAGFNDSLIEKIKLCTHTFCALGEPHWEATKIAGAEKVSFLHEGYDHLSNYPIDTPYKYDYCFIGNPRGWRQKYVQALNIPIISNAYGKEHSQVVSETKINLNFTEGGTSDRTYKVLASKGFLLTEPWDGMERDFTIGKDLDVFTNVEELKNKIEFYLTNEQLRKEIANNGFNSVQKFDRIRWAKQIMDKI